MVMLMLMLMVVMLMMVTMMVRMLAIWRMWVSAANSIACVKIRYVRGSCDRPAASGVSYTACAPRSQHDQTCGCPRPVRS
eukprot:50247-Pyramimonas_sp.AAC.2